jgi:hypothetical protein
VLFAVQPPPEIDRKRHAAFSEICRDLKDQNVRVVNQSHDAAILEFATT